MIERHLRKVSDDSKSWLQCPAVCVGLQPPGNHLDAVVFMYEVLLGQLNPSMLIGQMPEAAKDFLQALSIPVMLLGQLKEDADAIGLDEGHLERHV